MKFGGKNPFRRKTKSVKLTQRDALFQLAPFWHFHLFQIAFRTELYNTQAKSNLSACILTLTDGRRVFYLTSILHNVLLILRMHADADLGQGILLKVGLSIFKLAS